MTAIKRIALATIALAVALALATVNPASALAQTAGPAVSIETLSKGPLTFNKKDGTVTGKEEGDSPQLGHFTVKLEGTGTVNGTTLKAQGTFTVFTAAGDQLTGRFTTTGDLGKQRSADTITGGTGRFAHASGTIIVDCVTLEPPHETEDTLTLVRQCTGRGELHL